MKSKSHFIALLTYVNAEEGTMTTPVSSGYRPAIKFPFGQGLFIGIQNFIGTDLVFPGDAVKAEIILVTSEDFTGKLYKGLDFEFFEGPILIGYGVITKVNDLR